jgi:hypothetical protein
MREMLSTPGVLSFSSYQFMGDGLRYLTGVVIIRTTAAGKMEQGMADLEGRGVNNLFW